MLFYRQFLLEALEFAALKSIRLNMGCQKYACHFCSLYKIH